MITTKDKVIGMVMVVAFLAVTMAVTYNVTWWLPGGAQ